MTPPLENVYKHIWCLYIGVRRPRKTFFLVYFRDSERLENMYVSSKLNFPLIHVWSSDTVLSVRWWRGFVLTTQVPLGQTLVSVWLVLDSQRIFYWAEHWLWHLLGKFENLMPYIINNDKCSAKRRYQNWNHVQALYANWFCSITLWQIQLCVIDIKDAHAMDNVNT